jgi:Na+/H+-dicarboxylate symporter
MKLTTWIFIGMLAGIGVGYMCHELLPTPESAKITAGYISLFTDIFLRLIKMIIAPLVFSTLVVGIAHMGDTASIGRIGVKTMAWFISASLLSLLLGLVMVNMLRPGEALNLPLPDASASANLKVASLSFKEFVTHLVPRSAFEAMANNEILQIVVFSVFFGAAAAALGDKAKAMINWVEELSHIILKITGYVMSLAPIAVFAAMASVVTTSGLGILVTYGKFVVEFYLSLGLLWMLIAFAAWVFLRDRVFTLLRMIREPLLLSFTTASSEAAYPKTLEQLERFGAKKKIVSFVLPLGYSFNLDGSMMYCTFAVLFIAQAYNIALTPPAADHDAADPDGDEQGDGRRAAGVAGGDCGDARDVQHSRGRAVAHHGHRPVPRHGALGDQRHRQQRRDRGGGEVGRRARQKRARAGARTGGARGRVRPTVTRALLGLLLAGALALPADAQELTGTLKKIKDAGSVTLGYRESSSLPTTEAA